MKTARLIIVVVMVIIFALLVVQDYRNDIPCEGVYLEHDSSYVFYYDENVNSFVIEARKE